MSGIREGKYLYSPCVLLLGIEPGHRSKQSQQIFAPEKRDGRNDCARTPHASREACLGTSHYTRPDTSVSPVATTLHAAFAHIRFDLSRSQPTRCWTTSSTRRSSAHLRPSPYLRVRRLELKDSCFASTSTIVSAAAAAVGTAALICSDLPTYLSCGALRARLHRQSATDTDSRLRVKAVSRWIIDVRPLVALTSTTTVLRSHPTTPFLLPTNRFTLHLDHIVYRASTPFLLPHNHISTKASNPRRPSYTLRRTPRVRRELNIHIPLHLLYTEPLSSNQISLLRRLSTRARRVTLCNHILSLSRKPNRNIPDHHRHPPPPPPPPPQVHASHAHVESKLAEEKFTRQSGLR
ncbi:hypothetical protein KCU81_g51, partial [Aureobasidium melanogenum]